jgi:cytochrome b subunit of formate dehydrogenase
MKKYILIHVVCCVLVFPTAYLTAQTKTDCLTCHSDQSLTMEKGGKAFSVFVNESVLDKSPHKKLSCITCHTGFDPDNIPHKVKIEPVNCLTCHKNTPLTHTFHPQIARALDAHEALDISCTDCHGTHNVESPKVEGSKFHVSKVIELCGECHSDVRDHFVVSAHGKALSAGIQGAPTCISCHKNNVVKVPVDQDSTHFKIAQEKLCLSCHLDNPDVRARTSTTAGFIAAYEKSVHGKALLNGNADAANCVDCHGSHDMAKGAVQASQVNREHIPETCAKCHADIAAEFGQSVHGVAAANGVKDAPVCTDCHGEHKILRHTDPKSRVAAGNVSVQVCSPCHSSVKLSEKYGIATNRFQTFSDSYHGLAIRVGSVEVANCASCHGIHNIKSSSDPTSTINQTNLVKTCGKCHPGANKRFTVGSVHVNLAEQQEPLLYWIASLYIVLIVVLIGGMFLHNLMDFIKKSKRKLKIRRGLLHQPELGHSLYVRMTLDERIQHGTLQVSFTILVFTGFALKFPDAWWVTPIRSISPLMFEIRSIVHRVAGVVMLLVSLYHLYYIFFVPRGKQLLRDLFPVLQDVYDAIAVLKYNFGISKIKPKFGRFSYIEKSEYWALVWGTIVMGATGAILWFDNTFLGLLTKLYWDAARTIHYYEAWLATLAIIVWHFYFVIFNPDVYPINLAFWKGTITEEEMEDEHPLELEEVRQQEMIAETENAVVEDEAQKFEEVKK